MKYVGLFSAKVYDLLEKEGKKQLLLFGQSFSRRSKTG